MLSVRGSIRASVRPFIGLYVHPYSHQLSNLPTCPCIHSSSHPAIHPLSTASQPHMHSSVSECSDLDSSFLNHCHLTLLAPASHQSLQTLRLCGAVSVPSDGLSTMFKSCICSSPTYCQESMRCIHLLQFWCNSVLWPSRFYAKLLPAGTSRNGA